MRDIPGITWINEPLQKPKHPKRLVLDVFGNILEVQVLATSCNRWLFPMIFHHVQFSRWFVSPRRGGLCARRRLDVASDCIRESCSVGGPIGWMDFCWWKHWCFFTKLWRSKGNNLVPVPVHCNFTMISYDVDLQYTIYKQHQPTPRRPFLAVFRFWDPQLGDVGHAFPASVAAPGRLRLSPALGAAPGLAARAALHGGGLAEHAVGHLRRGTAEVFTSFHRCFGGTVGNGRCFLGRGRCGMYDAWCLKTVYLWIDVTDAKKYDKFLDYLQSLRCFYLSSWCLFWLICFEFDNFVIPRRLMCFLHSAVQGSFGSFTWRQVTISASLHWFSPVFGSRRGVMINYHQRMCQQRFTVAWNGGTKTSAPKEIPQNPTCSERKWTEATWLRVQNTGYPKKPIGNWKKETMFPNTAVSLGHLVTWSHPLLKAGLVRSCWAPRASWPRPTRWPRGTSHQARSAGGRRCTCH